MKRKLCTAVLTLALLCTLAPSALAFDTAYVGRTETLGRGLTYSVMLDENGTLLGVGQGGYYELGWIYVYGGTEGAAPILSGVLSLSAGPVHAGAIDRNGGLWMWGRNDSGEIGNGQEGWYDEGLQSLIQREPVQVLDHVAAVSCGWGNTAAIRTDGTLWVWGDALYCGNGGVGNAVIALAVISWPKYARIARGQTLAVKSSEYIAAARLAGSTPLKILFRHILPNIFESTMVWFTNRIGGAVLSVASLSYLGLGLQPPTPDWGIMIKEARTYFLSAPLLALAPGICIVLFVLSIHVLGDWLRDRADVLNERTMPI